MSTGLYKTQPNLPRYVDPNTAVKVGDVYDAGPAGGHVTVEYVSLPYRQSFAGFVAYRGPHAAGDMPYHEFVNRFKFVSRGS